MADFEPIRDEAEARERLEEFGLLRDVDPIAWQACTLAGGHSFGGWIQALRDDDGELVGMRQRGVCDRCNVGFLQEWPA